MVVIVLAVSAALGTEWELFCTCWGCGIMEVPDVTLLVAVNALHWSDLPFYNIKY